MTKLFIDPGHGGRDPGAVGNGLKEKDLTLAISNRVRQMLIDDYHGVEVKMSRTTDTFVSLADRSHMANNWRADYFLSIHVNAGGGTGFESFIHSSRATRTVSLQAIIHDQMMNTIHAVDRGKKSANFAVLRQTVMPAILTENLFIDRVADAVKLKSASYIQSLARGHVEGLVRAFSLQKRSAELQPTTLHKVQGGAFRSKANADQRKSQLEQAGYHTLIVFHEGLYRVQLGAFANLGKANSLATELKQKGFDSYIVRT
ncbi:N-acetylmuramoyl-L-alanine amidase [Alkalicoccobacillus murimartini]|uniref:N-acetylmuramoyl-L-alanine amidase n=1 Tax=Alkalicoccobacillus murimartini TaxID=171685 RepID=A0ABT9YDV4_9BACI|nr:N-acetylmuramoyl-L-alanine amidase [Alkalicoccobacillus murimartini]MDQ0206035.1 N-acetylmuramoyl-L-alanine amidase [Alkalicoccobacillus murimartini]